MPQGFVRQVEHDHDHNEGVDGSGEGEVKYSGKYCMHGSVYDESKRSEEGGDPFDSLITGLSRVTNQPKRSVFLCPSGMQAIHAALRLSRRARMEKGKKPGSAVVYGFPYLDTLKMCGRRELSDGVEFFGFGDVRDLNALKFLLSSRKALSEDDDSGVACLITEFPSNPLLNIPDITELRRLADEHDFVLVVDDTIGNFANVDLLKGGFADVVCTSLTKIYNGRGDAIAGSLIVGSEGRRFEELTSLMNVIHDGNNGALYVQDANAVARNSVDFLERSAKINETTEKLADWLKGREEVKKIYYPKFTQPELYSKFLVRGQGAAGGYGGLFSIILGRDVCERTFYDELNVSKVREKGRIRVKQKS